MIVDLDTLDLRLLRAFQLVARHGGLRLAAARLGQTIPAVSAKLRRLEDELSVELFERRPNRLVLTRTGERFLREVDAVFARTEEALRSLVDEAEPAGRLAVSIGSDHSWYFAPRIGRFLRRFPRVEVSVQVYRAADALDDLARGALDVSIGIFPKHGGDLATHVIERTPLCLLSRRDDPLLARGPQALVELARARLIVLPSHAETRKLVDRALHRTGARPESVIEVANCQIGGTLAQAGVGVAILHALCVAEHAPENTAWVSLGAEVGDVAFAAVCRPSSLRSMLVRSFLSEMGVRLEESGTGDP